MTGRDYPAVSVVMPVYNAERYIGSAIESVIKQTYRDLEFIIINDGSVDESAAVIARYARLDGRIRVISRTNRGLPASLNEGVAAAKGAWIARMDADDICSPSRVARQLYWLRVTGADVCGGWMRLFGTWTRRTYRYPAEDEAIRLQLCFRAAFAHPTMMVRTSLLRDVPYDECARHAEDYDLCTRFALAGARMTNLQARIVRYRVHANQVSQRHEDAQRVNRERAQRTYVARMVASPNAFQVMRLFAGPSEAPSIDDARALLDILMSISWATATTRLAAFAGALRYVRPSSLAVFELYEEMRQRLHLTRDRTAIPLLVQSALGLSSDSRAYSIVKRFI